VPRPRKAPASNDRFKRAAGQAGCSVSTSATLWGGSALLLISRGSGDSVGTPSVIKDNAQTADERKNRYFGAAGDSPTDLMFCARVNEDIID
jgi:hypothetical protein